MSRDASIDQQAAAWILRRDSGLSPAEEAELARWRESDPRHAAALARKDRAWSALDRPRAAGQADLILDRLTVRAQARRRRRVAAATGALVIALAVGLWWQDRPAPPATDVAPARGVVLRPETRTLPDGSVVELRPGTSLEVQFDASTRRVVLAQGEAHFRVAKQPARPFVVAAAQVEFRAVGTAFTIQLGEDMVEMLVTEGTVAVAPTPAPVLSAMLSGAAVADPIGSASHPGSGGAAGLTFSPFIVEAGKRVEVTLAPGASSEPQVAALTEAELTHRLAWRAPKVEFSEIPLAEAVAMLNEHNRVKFIIDDAELARLPVSGVFRADNTDAFVRLLEGSFGVEAVRGPDTLLLRRARP